MTIGKFTLNGNAKQNNALREFVRRASFLIGKCIDPVQVTVKPRKSMPKYAPGLYSMGFWRNVPHHIWLADDCFDEDKPELAEKTLGHEIVHVMQDDWFTRWHRRELLPYLKPTADNWMDMTIGTEFEGYAALPTECLATWGSAALFGWDRPAYSTLYKRRILASDFPAVAAIMTAER